MRKLHQNGLSFDKKSEAIPILTAYLFHELHCVEGPWMLYRQGIRKCTKGVKKKEGSLRNFECFLELFFQKTHKISFEIFGSTKLLNL